MASSFDDDFEADAWPDLLAEFGVSITHRPLGDPANDVSTTAIVSESEPQDVRDGGRHARRSATIQLDNSVDGVTTRSQFVVGSEVWDATTPPQRERGGRVVVSIVRTEEEFRKPQGGF